MYERFTGHARKVMQLANQEALRFNHAYIDPLHILLGLIKDGSGTACEILKNHGIDFSKLRYEIEKRTQSGPDMVSLGKLPQTPSAKKVIEHAMEEARGMNHDYVGTEHLLLGILRDISSAATNVLTKECGITLAKVREEVVNLSGIEEAIPASTSGQTLQLQAGQVFLDFLSDAGASADEVVTLLQILRRPQPPSDATDELVVLYLYVVRGQVMLPFERLVAGLKGHDPSRKAVPTS